MKDSLLEILYEQILFFTENGHSSIEHPNFMIQEIHKSSGKPRKEIIKLFQELNEILFIEKVHNEKYAYLVNQMMEVSEIEKQLKTKM